MSLLKVWNKRNRRKSVSSLLIVLMLLSMLPTGVLAVESPSPIDPGAITGKVTVGVDGVAGALVEVVRQDIYGGWLSAGETMTTEDGSFTFTNIPPGAYGLLISPPQGELHLQFAEFFVVNVVSGVTTALAPIELLIGGAITGTVTDGVNGVAGALVEVVWRDIYGPWWYAGDVRTRDGGSFTIPNMPPGSYDLRISPPHGALYLLATEVLGVTVASGVTTALAPIELLIGGAITGKVTDGVGGVDGAWVEVVRQDIYGGWLSAREARTGSGGSFAIPSIPPGTYNLRIYPPHGALYLLATEVLGVIVAESVTTASDTIELPIGGAITGTVTDGVNGVAGALVEVVREDIYEGWLSAQEAWTGSDGSFTIPSIPPGTHNLRIYPPHRAPYLLVTEVLGVIVAESETTKLGDIVLLDAKAAVEAAEAALLTTQEEVVAAQGLHDAALALVNALPEGTEKTALLARLAAVQTNINAAQAALDLAAAIAAAEAAVDATETALLTTQEEVVAAQGLHDAALALVNALPEGTEKTALLGRLVVVLRNIMMAKTPVIEITSPAEGATFNGPQVVTMRGRVFSRLGNKIDDVFAWRGRHFDEVITITSDVYGKFVYEHLWINGTSSLDGPFIGGKRLSREQYDSKHFKNNDGKTGIRFTGQALPGEKVTFRHHGYELIENSWTELTLNENGGFAVGVTFEAGDDAFIIWARDSHGNFVQAIRRITVLPVVVPPAPAPAPSLGPAPAPTPTPTPTPPTVVEQPIVAGQTTEVELEDVVTVTITAGAITGDAPKITAQLMPAAAAAALIAEANGVGLTAASEVVVLTMTGGEFTAPVQLSLNFDAAKVAAGQVPGVFVYNERTRRWIFLGGQVGVGTITVTVDRFSKFAVFATTPLPALADIADHWGRGSIRTLAGMGIVSGFPDGKFNPNAGVTRAEFVSMLTRALGLTVKTEAAARFTDAAGWAQGAIGAAAEAGLIAGYADGTFGGSRRITRAEMAVILQRVIRKGLVPVTFTAGADFADAGAFPAWAADGIRTASTAGLVRGFQDRTFRPGSVTTRAEAAAMLYRLVAER